MFKGKQMKLASFVQKDPKGQKLGHAHTQQTFSCERVSECVLTCNERIRTWEKQNKTRAVCFSMLPLLLEFLTSVFRFQNSQLSFSLDIMELSLNVTRFLVTLCLCAREKSYTCSFSLSLSFSICLLIPNVKHQIAK